MKPYYLEDGTAVLKIHGTLKAAHTAFGNNMLIEDINGKDILFDKNDIPVIEEELEEHEGHPIQIYVYLKFGRKFIKPE